MSTVYPVKIHGQEDYEEKLRETLGTTVGPDEVYHIGDDETMSIDEFKDRLDR